MKLEEIQQKLAGIVQDFFKIDQEINAETTANDIKDWDSFTHMNLISEIEEAFKVKFNFADLMDFQNVGDLINSLKQKL